MRYTAAWYSRNVASFAGHYSPNGSLRINDGEPAVTEAAQSFMTAFPDLRVEMNDLRMEGDQPEYHWALLGKNTGPRGTGQQVRISGFEMWRMGEDGLIAESRGHFDNADYQRQLAEETLERGIQNDEKSRVAEEDLRRIGGADDKLLKSPPQQCQGGLINTHNLPSASTE